MMVPVVLLEQKDAKDAKKAGKSGHGIGGDLAYASGWHRLAAEQDREEDNDSSLKLGWRGDAERSTGWKRFDSSGRER